MSEIISTLEKRAISGHILVNCKCHECNREFTTRRVRFSASKSCSKCATKRNNPYLKITKEMEIIRTNTKEVILYCSLNSERFWAAKIISILLECDFRDCKQEAEKYLEVK